VVIMVVPFATLVDNLVARAGQCGLICEEWLDHQSSHDEIQLIVVSADRAVDGAFRHYAKGLELSRRLAYIFLDKCHIALTNTSY
jgi:hypothetical protein